MTEHRIVVAQTRTYLLFFICFTAVLAAAGILAVQRPIIDSYPAGLLIAAIFAVVGLDIFTSRLILDGQILSQRRYGRELWRVDLADARFAEEIDSAGKPVYRVEANGRKIGKIRAIYFDPRSFQRMLERIAAIQEHMPD